MKSSSLRVPGFQPVLLPAVAAEPSNQPVAETQARSTRQAQGDTAGHSNQPFTPRLKRSHETSTLSVENPSCSASASGGGRACVRAGRSSGSLCCLTRTVQPQQRAARTHRSPTRGGHTRSTKTFSSGSRVWPWPPLLALCRGRGPVKCGDRDVLPRADGLPRPPPPISPSSPVSTHASDFFSRVGGARARYGARSVGHERLALALLHPRARGETYVVRVARGAWAWARMPRCATPALREAVGVRGESLPGAAATRCGVSGREGGWESACVAVSTS